MNFNTIPLGRYLHLISKVYLEAFTHKLNYLDIDRHIYILTLIKDDEEISQKELACLLDIDKVTMSRIIDYLVKNKYIIRKQHSLDRRAFSLLLTSKAREILPKIRTTINELNKISFQGISESDKACFLSVSSKIATNLNRLPVDVVQFNYKVAVKKKKTNKKI
ncbi:MAG: MarR family transcriptional regulator [Bacteroidetes bacterium]|nr:MarR family transcriptional regulator [Bacteroidota bacterium]HET6245770.1 MarR family transcriptional regulator [Bacteroidia bacterium]